MIQPKRIVWTSEARVLNAENLLKPRNGQAVLSDPVPPLVLKPGAAIVLDFGVEIAGSVELFTTMGLAKGVSVRVRFGESVAEVMVDVGERGAQNDHALRDQVVKLPWLPWPPHHKALSSPTRPLRLCHNLSKHFRDVAYCAEVLPLTC